MKRKAVLSFVLTVLFLASVLLLSTYSAVGDSHISPALLGSKSTADPTDWWPMFHHDLSHTGTSTSTGPTTNNLLWNYTTINGVLSSPAVVGGLVYVGSADDNVYCLNAANGSQVWNCTTGGIVSSSPAVVGGLVYVGSADNNTYCLNATTGLLVWNYTTGGPVESSPAVVGGLVYVGSDDRNVYCLNAASGSLVWNYTTGDWVGSSPAVAGGLVYVGSWDDNVYCLNAVNGSLVWNYKTGASVYSSPAVVDGLVYVGSFDHDVYCLNATTGTQVWNCTTGGIVSSSPAVVGGLVYVGSADNNTYCLNAANGTLVWSYTTDGSVDSSPAVVNGVVYVGSEDGNVYAFGPLPLAVSIAYTSATMDAGQSQLFISTVSGGTPPYSYKWYLDGSPVGNNSTSYWYIAAEGSHEVYVNVTDSASAPVTVESNTTTVTVNSAVTVSIAPTYWIMYVNQTELFTATVSGGTASFSYQWYLNGLAVSEATNATWTFAPASAGLYNLYVNITDGVGAEAMSNVADVVAARLTPEFPSYLILPLFMMATLLAAFVLKRKRGRSK